MRRVIFSLIITVMIISCKPSSGESKHKSGPLIAKDTTTELERNNSLFVFVGEKINITPIPYESGDFDVGVEATYKILLPVYGGYEKDTIEFVAYDHYGMPEFTKYKTVLLFVSEYKGNFYQEKYMFDPVVKARNGRWAGPYSSEYSHPYNKQTSIKPQKIDFTEQIEFPTSYIDQDGIEHPLTYPTPYFKVTGDKAIAVYGNYIEDLFKLRKEGVLTARDLFPGKEFK